MADPKFVFRNPSIERIASWLFVVALIVALLVYFSSFLQPLVLAVMVWYFIYLLKEIGRKIKIRKRPLPEWLLTTLAFIFIFMISYGVVEIVMFNLERIIDRFPIYLGNLRDMFRSIQQIDGYENLQIRLIERLDDVDFRPVLTGLLNSLSSFAGNIFMIIIYVGFLVAEQKFFRRKLDKMVDDSTQSASFFHVFQQAHKAIRIYVAVKTQMSLLTGLLSYVILLLFGVDFPILWAFLIFLLNYIPYIGSLVATLLPAAFAVLQFQSFAIFVWVFVCIEIVQVLVGNVLEPKVMGTTLNLSPLGVLLALTFWGILWGVLGMIISVPITSILVIIASHVPSLRFLAIWFSETGEVYEEPIPR